MKKFNLNIPILVAMIVLSAASVTAQPAKVASTGGKSPHETTSARFGGTWVTITYGRPYSKDPKTGETRAIWGKLVPWDKAWRAGSDEATLLVCDQTLVIGGIEVPAGAYTLYIVPSESGATKMAISKHIGKWGIAVDEKNDLARVDMKKDVLNDNVDQFTITIAPDGTGGVIQMKWEKTQFSVPFTIKK